MTTKSALNRTNPNKASREAISNLSNNRVLSAEFIGVRSIVEAEQEIIRPIGLDAIDRKGFIFTPRCIKLLHGVYGLKFTHNNTKSTMSAVLKSSHHPSCMIDPAATLPRNHLAERLLEKGSDEGECLFNRKDSQLYGDAVLVEDVRKHWCLNRYTSTNIDLVELYDDLTTPRRLRGYANEQVHSILFEEEPNSDDLMFLSMKFL